MNVAQFLSTLFDLGQSTGFWNSTQAASDFWMIFAVVAGLLIATIAVRSNGHHREPRLRH